MIEVVRSVEHVAVSFSRKQAAAVVEFVLHSEKKNNASIHIIFVGDKYITAINKKFLNHNFTTDVITFPLEKRKIISAEIYLNVQQAKRQAKEFAVTLNNEITRLIIHGTLHAIGYDDTEPKLQKRMIQKQERYVEKFGSLV